MKTDKLLSCLWGAAVAFLLALGAAGSLGTGFGMDVGGKIILILGGAAVFFAVCFGLFGGAGLAFGVLALAGGYLWRSGALILQMKSFLYRISSYYDAAYGWGVLSWSGGNLNGISRTIPLALIGCLVALTVAWTVCRRRRVWLAVGIAVLPIAACVVVTDTVPDSRYLFLYLLGMVLLIMGQTVRRRNAAEGNRLMLMLTVPAALAVALLFLLVPEDRYVPPDNTGEEMILGWIDSFQKSGVEENVTNWFTDVFISTSPETVDLKNTGPRTDYQYKVMDVVAAQTGPLYLRGKAYDCYDGESWSISGGDWEQAFSYAPIHYAEGLSGVLTGMVQITTRGVHDVLYFPYNPGNVSAVKQGSVPNSDGAVTYSMIQLEVELPESDDPVSLSALGMEMNQYLNLPAATRARGQDYLAAHMVEVPYDSLNAQTYMSLAEEIGELVSASAVYDLDTSRMPAVETDFAMWFLEESDTGYCVHFATAAAVLLRAAGIPARYVTGYLVDGIQETEVTVRGGDAHAWVEYWHPYYGWLKLEATPGGTESTPGESDSAADSSEATRQSETQPETTRGNTQNGGNESGNAGETTLTPSEQEQDKLDLSWVRGLLKQLLVWAGIAALILAQWKLRIMLRHRRINRGSPNAQALARWQVLNGRMLLLRDTPPEPMRVLAEKAKFSQHEITGEELAALDRELELAEDRMRRKGLLLRLIYRLVFAAY